MSITSQIIRIQTNIANAYDAAEAKGATLPTTKNSENLPNTIASITTGGGAGGDSITYTNITGATIAKDDKLWINTTAITTEKASAQLGSSVAHVIQTSNPNVAVTTNKLFTLQDGAYVQSSLAKTITMNKVGIDKNGLLFSSNTLYDIENNIFYNGSFTSYVGNGYVYYSNKMFKVDITNPANILNTYSGPSSSQMSTGWCFEDDIIIGFHAYHGYCRVWKLNTDTTGFNQLKSLSLGAITAIGQFSEQKIGWGLKGNSDSNLNLGAYRYSRNGDDVNVEEIPATEFPEDMRPMFTEQPSHVFWNEQTLTLTASWASTTPNKVLIFKYINGEWINKTPVISEFVSGLGYITCDSSVSKIIVSGTATTTPIIYDGNETASGYYAVPYLYSRKESLIGKAQSDVAINQTGKATTVLFDSKVTPEPSVPDTPAILKFGDRIDNKATVVGTFDSNDGKKYAFAVLDAQYRGADIAWSTGLEEIDTSLPNYSSSPTEQNKESATYNTDHIINNYTDKAIEAFTFVRSITPVNFNDKQYDCQLPNAYELQQIYNMKTELDTLDPTAETNSTKKLSNWGFGSQFDNLWSSNGSSTFHSSWLLKPDGSWDHYSRLTSCGVCPIIEIPLKEV